MLNTVLLSALLLGQTAGGDKITIKDDLVGKGPQVKSGDIVSVDYTGALPDGTQFDTSIGRAPFLFVVGAGQVIKGWDLGVAGMHEGGKRELTIPASLGYGARTVGSIPANSVLHFTITLRKIEPDVQSTVITAGKGSVAAKYGDVAFVHFKGGPKGGKEIFDTRDNGKDPVPIQIGEPRLPIGFVPSLVGMKEGEVRRVIIPSDLAYGEKGVPAQDRKDAKGNVVVKAGSLVPPNAEMEFTFELVTLQKSGDKH